MLRFGGRNPLLETTFDADGTAPPRSRSLTDLRFAEPGSFRGSMTSLAGDGGRARGPSFTADMLGSMLRSGAPSAVSRSPLPAMLPALIELNDNEDYFFRCVITECQPGSMQFKLSPAFALYMAARYRISRQFQPQTPFERRVQMFRFFIGQIIDNIGRTVASHQNNAEYLTFWLSNSSEFLYILRGDTEIQNILSSTGHLERMQETVEHCYYYLACLIQKSIEQVMGVMTNADMPDKQSTDEVINVLEATMTLFRANRLNAGLTIQLFSHSFYYINQYLFNWMVATPDGRSHLSRAWGVRLRDRLQFVHLWAEKQGLELAAECHMDRIQQAANLLITPKTIDQIASLGATCYKLNSVQVRWLLTHYVSDVCEPEISVNLIDNVVRLAEGQADEVARQDAQSVELEEAKTLDMQFMFPPDGYSIEMVRDLPPGMNEFFHYCQMQGGYFFKFVFLSPETAEASIGRDFIAKAKGTIIQVAIAFS
uniref:Dilute domain-containing protein n=1 Tax=Steinernema glaseri TaxID=37863 RepID=A0A1I7ZXG6_9BILA